MHQDYDIFKHIFSHLDKMFEHKTIFKSYLNFQIALQNKDGEEFCIFRESSMTTSMSSKAGYNDSIHTTGDG